MRRMFAQRLGQWFGRRWYGTASRESVKLRSPNSGSLHRMDSQIEKASDDALEQWFRSMSSENRLKLTAAVCAPLSEEARREAARLFKEIDVNMDGKICATEFNRWYVATTRAARDTGTQGAASIPQPSFRQLTMVGVRNMVPMIGFGFVDNFIMIAAGESIDSTLGSSLHLTTMAAAGMGNLVSDVAGIGLSSTIEAAAGRLGLPAHNLTLEQLDLKSSRVAASIGSVIGISFGCLLGMMPLLFVGTEKNQQHGDDGDEQKVTFDQFRETVAALELEVDEATLRSLWQDVAGDQRAIAMSGLNKVLAAVNRASARC